MDQESEQEVFNTYLKSRNLKMTREREVILKEVFDRHDHFDADQLVDDLKKKGANVSRATVYRTLDLLLESNLIQSVNVDESRRYFEHTFGHEHHDHMICIKCGTLVEFVNEEIEKLQNEEADKAGFEIISHRLEIRGLCVKCREDNLTKD